MHHNPYESFPNTVVINPSKSSSEIHMTSGGVGAAAPHTGSYIEHPVENSQYGELLDLIAAANLNENGRGSFGDYSNDRSQGLGSEKQKQKHPQ